MDTKTLVVGQDVYMVNSRFMCKGKVTEITPLGVNVQTTDELLQFNNEGVQCDNDGKPFIAKCRLDPGSDDEGGTWELTDHEQKVQRYEDGVTLHRAQAAELRRKYEAKKK
jgi:hypothetical protein